MSAEIDFKKVEENNKPTTKIFSGRKRKQREPVKYLNHLLVSEALLLVLGGMCFGFAAHNEMNKETKTHQSGGWGVAQK